jgi:hypothetical protein
MHQSSRPALGHTAPRYERNLKERLGAGEVIRQFDGRFEIASMRKDGAHIVMTGFTGTHRIGFDVSSNERVDAHWQGFCYLAGKAKQQTRAKRRR